MKALDRHTFEQIAQRVIEHCLSRDIQGVFAMVDLTSPDSSNVIYWTPVMMHGVLKLNRPEGKQDTNSLGMALSKIAGVIAHRKNTGGDESTVEAGQARIRGEVPYLGGRISKDLTTGYAFSGGTQEEDDELMQDAEEYHSLHVPL